MEGIEKEHNWEIIHYYVELPGYICKVCKDCKIYGREMKGKVGTWINWDTSSSKLSCQEIREKLESHQFTNKMICNKCGLKLTRADTLYFWNWEVLSCDEAIIKGIIE
jgi:hypothetical protein